MHPRDVENCPRVVSISRSLTATSCLRPLQNAPSPLGRASLAPSWIDLLTLGPRQSPTHFAIQLSLRRLSRISVAFRHQTGIMLDEQPASRRVEPLGRGKLPSPPDTVASSEGSSFDSGSESEESSSNAEESLRGGSRAYPLPPPSNPETGVLDVDLKTPDKHVPRDPRLIRLTGAHPFNVEAPLSELYDEGFLTSKDLHFVRNHGYVPKVDDDEIMDWEFTVEGLVDSPLKLRLAQLINDFEQVTYPVTLVCAGNRRKEQNIVRKTKGFSWGAAGLSTALWTGVVIGDLLKAARPNRRARYVCFEGADKLPNGHYGTSVKMSWAMDRNRGIMVAHRMNGEALSPDHGKPLRIIVPGQIGGRSVKWLKRIILTEAPSGNWYHIYDNRVLPTMIEPEQSANLPETWKDERYAIYDLNTNSAICYPAHDETLSLSDPPDIYSVRGYAYAGGGKRVTRVEITLDKGKTWNLANITYHEDRYRSAPDGENLYGGRLDVSWRDNCFCWCFWDLDISVADMQRAKDIMVRAMDDSMMVQPRDMYWSVLGMMNNPWFRIVIRKDTHGLRFEHPTQPALIRGGWMERVKNLGGDLTNGYWGEKMLGEEDVAVPVESTSEISLINKDVKRVITIDELREHGDEISPWFVVHGEVYNATAYLEAHPGGAASIFSAAGQNATEEFMAIHSENAKAMLPDYHIGTLDQASRTELAGVEATPTEEATSRETFLQSKTWSRGILSAKKCVSTDTKIFTFDLEHPAQTIGLPIGQHVMLRLRDPVTREAIIRLYTPVSEIAEKGKLHLLVKIYYHAPERKGGRMSQALDAIPVGHFVDFKGPMGKFEYLGRGRCSLSGVQRNIKRFVMVCAGTGITPIFQLFRAVLRDPEDTTFCLLLDGNRGEEDILCKEELDTLAADNEHKCKLVYTLSQPGARWQGLRGRLDQALLEKEIVEFDRDLALVCGPESLVESVHSGFLAMGWKDEDIFIF